jgi:DNA-binding NarL/FixJ family response regulator
MNKIKVLIADDHPIFRKGLVEVISLEPGFQLVSEAPDGVTALNMINLYKPDVAVLDINMPGKTGFEIVKELNSEKINVKIIFLTMHNEEDILNRAIDLGVMGYVLKDSAMEDLIEAIHSVASGKRYVSPFVSEYLINRSSLLKIDGRQKSAIEKLTPAEKQILQLIAEEKTSKEIADLLFISIRTVDNHRMNICNKLSIHGANALLKFALENKRHF